MNTYLTEQEAFWAGSFGDTYIERNRGQRLVAANIALFSRVLRRAAPISSIIEFGANVGNNLLALRHLCPNARFTAVEINETACAELRALGWVHTHHGSALEFQVTSPSDLALTKGLLIHIYPDSLPRLYDRLYAASRRYICIVEYYNPVPVEVPYRGHNNRLFKRDFAGELLERFPQLRLVDYGFVYHRDTNFPMDDLTWFLLEKDGENP
jgi:spore coat polysaccharide biosynthesis protein SpsF